MTTAIPFPVDEVLFAAAREDRLIPCHQCKGDLCRRADCPACLGSGFIRACGRCFSLFHSQACAESPCLICCGLHYTASDNPSRETNFNARPVIVARHIRSAEV